MDWGPLSPWDGQEGKPLSTSEEKHMTPGPLSYLLQGSWASGHRPGEISYIYQVLGEIPRGAKEGVV